MAFIACGDAYVYRATGDADDVTERERSLELIEIARAEAGLDAQVRYVASTSVGTVRAPR